MESPLEAGLGGAPRACLHSSHRDAHRRGRGTMRRFAGQGALVFLGVVLLLGCADFADSAEDTAFAGYWDGAFQILGDSVAVVLEVVPADSGLVAYVSLPGHGVRDMAAGAQRDGATLRIEVAPFKAAYEGRLLVDESTIRGDWLQARGKFRLDLARTEEPPRPRRPQEPRPPFPYGVEDVRIAHSDGQVVLAGTLSVPEGPGPHPAAVLVSGSGPQDRDETLFEHRPFNVLADHLSRSGIAVLRYDDRGVAESTGDFAASTTQDFAIDALAALEWLAERPDVDPARVGIIGHSEGGIVAPIAASRSERVRFIVTLASTGIPGRELLELQTELIMDATDTPAPLMALSRRAQRELLDRLEEAGSAEGALEMAREELESSWGGLTWAALNALGLAAQVDQAMQDQLRAVASPWLFYFLQFDPATAFEQVRVPVLALNGSLDLQVPPDPNLRRIREALERGGNTDVTTMELPGLNHLFQTATTGLPTEYATIEETMAPEVLTIVTDWIVALEPQGVDPGARP
jgi:fermentation-respiration switch protein FrsA (DUF1100 family)